MKNKKQEERQLLLHVVLMMYTNLRKAYLCCGERKVTMNTLNDVLDLDNETVHICNNSLQCLHCMIDPKTQERLQNDTMLPEPRNTEKY